MRRWEAQDGGLADGVSREIAAVIEAGGVIAVPTETYYGLAAHAYRQPGLRVVQRLKRRGRAEPLLLLISGTAMARSLCPDAPATLELLAECFWPGPLTLVAGARRGLAPPLVSADGGVAVRHSSHPVVQCLLEALAAPMTGTSANVTGELPVCTAGELSLAERVGLAGVIDAGSTPGGAPSTLLDIRSSPPRVLREGAVATERIRRALRGQLL